MQNLRERSTKAAAAATDATGSGYTTAGVNRVHSQQQSYSTSETWNVVSHSCNHLGEDTDDGIYDIPRKKERNIKHKRRVKKIDRNGRWSYLLQYIVIGYYWITQTATTTKNKGQINNHSRLIGRTACSTFSPQRRSRRKLIIGALAFLLIIRLLFDTIDLCFQYFHDPDNLAFDEISSNRDTRSARPLSSLSSSPPPASAYVNETSFAVIINTYKRPKQLMAAVRHYADTCGTLAGVSGVFVIWSENDPPEDPETYFFPADTTTSFKSKLRNSNIKAGAGETNIRRAPVMIIPSKNSLNSRLYPIDKRLLDHNNSSSSISFRLPIARFMVDDDALVDCNSLRHGFRAWKVHPYSIVGYYPRLASSTSASSSTSSILKKDRTKDGSDTTIIGDEVRGKVESSTSPQDVASYVEHCWPIVFWRQRVNFVIATKATFLHERYMRIYWDETYHPKEIRDYIDRYMNCEDIAMSLLVANFTKYENMKKQQHPSNRDDAGFLARPAMPVYVQGTVSDAGLFNGISTGAGFVERRGKCIADLTAIYIKHGWGVPLDDVASTYTLQQVSYIQHFPGFWWQYKPSNFFEWLALLDVFR